MLNGTMRLIISTIKSTPTTCILNNIAPPKIRWKLVTKKEWLKFKLMTDLFFYIWIRFRFNISGKKKRISNGWKINSWLLWWETEMDVGKLGKTRTDRDVPNLISSNGSVDTIQPHSHGTCRCGDMELKWILINNPAWDYDHPMQTVEHVAFECSKSRFDVICKICAQWRHPSYHIYTIWM